MTNEDLNTYRMLYRFLKENGIFGNYVQNVIKQQNSKNKGAKSVLMELVVNHGKDHFNSSRCNLFNYAPTSFYWSCSIEGNKFWKPYFRKWNDFFNNNKEKYNLA